MRKLGKSEPRGKRRDARPDRSGAADELAARAPMSLRVESADEAETPADEGLRTGSLGAPAGRTGVGGKAGLLPRQEIRSLVGQRAILAKADLEESQFQPASLDLRLGAKAYRVRASFLPGAAK